MAGSSIIEFRGEQAASQGNPMVIRKNRGFTLIELIVVLVIIGIIAGVAIPRYSGSFNTIHFRKTMSELVFFLREARIKAMSTGMPTYIGLDLHCGYCWNEDKEIHKIPPEVDMFTNKIEARNDQTKIFTFYPNGTAQEEMLGFICDTMTAVLHIEPLGGLVYFNTNEEIEQVVRYSRTEYTLSDEEFLKNKAVDKKEVFATLTQDIPTNIDREGSDENLKTNKEADKETEPFYEDEDTDNE